MNKAFFPFILMASVLFTQVGALSSPLERPASQTVEFELNGQRVRMQDPYVNRFEAGSQGFWQAHNRRAYGAMYINFLVEMIATELIFCSNQYLPWVANNEEVPNCRDELEQMLFDPGMNIGFFFMAVISIEGNRRGDRVLRRFADRMKNRGRAGRFLHLSQTVLQHLSMGAGMMVQTSFASSWNEPKMRRCMAEIKKHIKNRLTENSIDSTQELSERENGQELVSSAVEEAQEEGVCKMAWDQFLNSQNGTLSEIYITIISLGLSSVMSAGTHLSLGGVLRLVGFTATRAHPIGIIIGGTSLAGTQKIIGIFDRYLEPIIREKFHGRQSRRQLDRSFDRLVEYVDKTLETENFITSFEKYAGCNEWETPPRISNPDPICNEERFETVNQFSIKSALDEYKSKLDYRREAKLNRFIENHNRWQQKVSSIISTISSFQSVIKKIIEIRQTIQETGLENLDTNFNSYGLINTYGELDELADINGDSLKGQIPHFSSEQLTEIYEIMNKVRRKISTNPYDRNRSIRFIIEDLHRALQQEDSRKIQVSLWRLKEVFSENYQERYDFTRSINIGHEFSEDELTEIRQGLTNLISGFSLSGLYSFYEFQNKGVPYLVESSEQVEENNSQDSQTQRGIQFQVSPIESLRLVNKDQSHLVSESLIGAKTIPSRIISQLACSHLDQLEFFHNEGRMSQMIFPNILKEPDQLNCDYRRNDYLLIDRRDYLQGDFLYNPYNGTLKLMQIDQATRGVFTYDGEEYLGLIDILTNPDIPIRWKSLDDFNHYWNQVMQPEVLKFLLRLRGEYYVSLKDFFDFNSSSVANISTSLTDEEVEERLESGFFNEASNASYYHNIYTGESFTDEVRTYGYVLRKLFGEDHHDTLFVNSVISQFHQMVSYLDISQNPFGFDYHDLSDSDVQNLIQTDPAVEVIGGENIGQFIDRFTKNLQAIQIRNQELGSSQGVSMTGVDLESLSREEAQNLILGTVYSNLEQSLHYLYETILDSYIGGNKIIFIPPPENQ